MGPLLYAPTRVVVFMVQDWIANCPFRGDRCISPFSSDFSNGGGSQERNRRPWRRGISFIQRIPLSCSSTDRPGLITGPPSTWHLRRILHNILREITPSVPPFPSPNFLDIDDRAWLLEANIWGIRLQLRRIHIIGGFTLSDGR